MATIPLGPSPVKQTSKGLAPFALGFRPFFLAAGVAALILMTLWLLMWMGRWPSRITMSARYTWRAGCGCRPFCSSS